MICFCSHCLQAIDEDIVCRFPEMDIIKDKEVYKFWEHQKLRGSEMWERTGLKETCQ